jgi:hypothetical protein
MLLPIEDGRHPDNDQAEADRRLQASISQATSLRLEDAALQPDRVNSAVDSVLFALKESGLSNLEALLARTPRLGRALVLAVQSLAIEDPRQDVTPSELTTVFNVSLAQAAGNPNLLEFSLRSLRQLLPEGSGSPRLSEATIASEGIQEEITYLRQRVEILEVLNPSLCDSEEDAQFLRADWESARLLLRAIDIKEIGRRAEYLQSIVTSLQD